MRRNECRSVAARPFAETQFLCGCLLRRLRETLLAPPLSSVRDLEELPDAVDGGFAQDDLDEDAGASDD
jgi:hypothetical protein